MTGPRPEGLHENMIPGRSRGVVDDGRTEDKAADATMAAAIPTTPRQPEQAEAAMAFRRSRRRTRGDWLACLSLVLLAACADHRGWLLARAGDDPAAYHGRTVAVDRLIDGDTRDVSLPDALNHSLTTRICLWGVDCP